MPIKRVQFPDGSVHRIEVPEGATNEQIIAFVQSQHPAAKAAAPKPAQPQSQSRIDAALADGKRGLGLTARYAISGPLEFAGIFTDPIAQQFGLGTARQGAQDLGDRLGLPNPATPGERVAGDVAKAVSGTGGFLGFAKLGAGLPGLAGRVGTAAQAQPVMQGVSAATGAGSAATARESGTSPGTQAAAGLIGGLLPGFGLFAAQATPRGVLRGGEQGRQRMEDTIADFRAAGATPSVGQATGNRRTQGAESLLAGAPTSSGVMTRFAERQAQQIGEGLQGKAAGLSPSPSAERAGLAIERGVDTFKGNANAQRRALYWQADKLIPAGTITPLSNTWATLRSLTTPNPGATATTGAMVNPKVANLFQTVGEDLAKAGGKGLPYDAVKAIRTRIGEELGDFSLTVDRPTREYKALYAALSKDVEEAAKAQGPAAQAAAKRANDYFRASQARLELLERVVDKAGGPEKVYQAALIGTQDGATTLRGVMRSLPQDGQRALTAAVVKRMGLATKGNQGAEGDTFSAQTFLTNWNGLSKEAKSALFAPIGAKSGAFGNGGRFVADMDKIARVAERIRDGSKVYANPSGTANRGLAYGYLGALLTAGSAGPTAFGGVLAGGLAANVLARVMVNPKVVAWLARTTELPASAAPQAIASLRAIGQAEQDDDIAALAEQLSDTRKE